MKVFISWSGELSELIAGQIRDWLPNVIQSVRPYFTTKDIDKGARWGTEIATELRESRVGIICLTPDNLESSWIMFEAGALSIAFTESKICPIMFGLNKADLRGPLIQFQAIDFEKQEVRGLLNTINSELGPEALNESTLDRVFDKWWPDLKSNINDVINAKRPDKPRQKTLEERHSEVLALLRQIIDLRSKDVSRHLAEDIFVNIYANIDAAAADQLDRLSYVEALLMLARNVEYLHQQSHRVPQHIERAHRLLERLSVEKSRLERGQFSSQGPLTAKDEVPF